MKGWSSAHTLLLLLCPLVLIVAILWKPSFDNPASPEAFAFKKFRLSMFIGSIGGLIVLSSFLTCPP